MKNLLKTEELLMFILSIYVFGQLNYAWWLFPALLLTPDIGMLGYLKDPKTGATVYNIFHHKGLAVIIGLIGLIFINDHLILTGVILFAHASMDRMFGFGLKYKNSFKTTHLGSLEKDKPAHSRQASIVA